MSAYRLDVIRKHHSPDAEFPLLWRRPKRLSPFLPCSSRFAFFYLALPQLNAPTSFKRREAQQSCPKDTVVWVNTRTGVYHFKGQRWYGSTKEGCYECQKEADHEGDRSTRNGQ
jgi:hypothetical protein